MRTTKLSGTLLIIALAVGLCAAGAYAGPTWQIYDAGLGDTINFDNYNDGTDGHLNDRFDLPGDPGYRFNVVLHTTTTAGSWDDISVADKWGFPPAAPGVVQATGNSGDLSGYTEFTMTFRNPGTNSFAAGGDDATPNGWFAAQLFIDTGFTQGPGRSPADDTRYETERVWLAPGETKTLVLDLTQCARLDELTNIGFKVGSHLVEGDAGDHEMTSGQDFDVDILHVPVPGAVLLGAIGLVVIGWIARKRMV